MKTQPDIAIQAFSLSKSFGQTAAASDISFDVGVGELFGLIGPDGAGKTTVFRMLTSLLIPDHGSATVLGLDTVKEYRKLRPRIGYMPGDFSLYRDLSVEENLTFFASIFNTTVAENYHLVEDIYVQLEPFRKRRADKLSGGMKQKLALCCALIHEPEVLFLDEPTTGVDAVSRSEFWDMLDRLIDRGITIVVSTPYMDEASRCHRVALMQEGRVMQIGVPQNISESYPHPLWSVRTGDMYRLPQDLTNADFTISAHRFGDSVHLTTRSNISPEEISEFLKAQGHQAPVLNRINASVEDVFLQLTQVP